MVSSYLGKLRPFSYCFSIDGGSGTIFILDLIISHCHARVFDISHTLYQVTSSGNSTAICSFLKLLHFQLYQFKYIRDKKSIYLTHGVYSYIPYAYLRPIYGYIIIITSPSMVIYLWRSLGIQFSILTFKFRVLHFLHSNKISNTCLLSIF